MTPISSPRSTTVLSYASGCYRRSSLIYGQIWKQPWNNHKITFCRCQCAVDFRSWVCCAEMYLQVLLNVWRARPLVWQTSPPDLSVEFAGNVLCQ